jgi:hypothetical protein
VFSAAFVSGVGAEDPIKESVFGWAFKNCGAGSIGK